MGAKDGNIPTVDENRFDKDLQEKLIGYEFDRGQFGDLDRAANRERILQHHEDMQSGAKAADQQ